MAVPHSTCVPHSCRSQPLFPSREFCSTHVQGKLPALPQDPHTTWDPALLTHTREDTWSLSWRCFTLQTWASRWEKKAENGEKVHRLVRQSMSGWKTAEGAASPHYLHEARAAVLMQGHSLQQLPRSCMAKSRERFPCWTSPFSCWYMWLHNIYKTRQILEIPEPMLECRAKRSQFPSQPTRQSITSTVVSRY